MDDYTDGYAIRVVITMRTSALARLDDSFGLLFSQYGYQLSYDSTSQQ